MVSLNAANSASARSGSDSVSSIAGAPGWNSSLEKPRAREPKAWRAWCTASTENPPRLMIDPNSSKYCIKAGPIVPWLPSSPGAHGCSSSVARAVRMRRRRMRRQSSTGRVAGSAAHAALISSTMTSTSESSRSFLPETCR